MCGASEQDLWNKIQKRISHLEFASPIDLLVIFYHTIAYPITITNIIKRFNTMKSVSSKMSVDDGSQQHDSKRQVIDDHKIKEKSGSSNALQYIEERCGSLRDVNKEGNLLLHRLMEKKSTTVSSDPSLILTMMEAYPAALQHQNNTGQLPLHIECRNQCRWSILSKCIKFYPKALEVADMEGNLPLHRLLRNIFSTIEAAGIFIAKYSTALQHPNQAGQLPLHIECKNQCRPAIIARCIELYPESMEVTDNEGNLLHILLKNRVCTIDIASMMMEKYPATLKGRNEIGQLPLHIECKNQCRSVVISKCIELYPEAVEISDKDDYLPLHVLLQNESSIIDDAL
jgi:ankyrin repeat protein